MVRATFNEPSAVSPYRGPYGGMHDGGRASPKNWKTVADHRVDLNADLRLTRCIFGP